MDRDVETIVGNGLLKDFKLNPGYFPKKIKKISLGDIVKSEAESMALSRQSAAFMENVKVLTYTSIALGKLDDEKVSGCKAETFQLYLQCLRDNLAGFKVDKTEKYWHHIITNGGIAILKLTKIYGVQILLFPLVFP